MQLQTQPLGGKFFEGHQTQLLGFSLWKCHCAADHFQENSKTLQVILICKYWKCLFTWLKPWEQHREEN